MQKIQVKTMPGRLNGSQALKRPFTLNTAKQLIPAAEITDRTTEKYFTAIVTKITELYYFIVEVHSENKAC